MKPQITVPTPCRENWNKMRSSGNGRFCSSCDKVVTDFTKMSDEELTLFFTTPASQHACGNFYNNQLKDAPVGKLERTALSWYQSAESNIKNKIPRLAAVFVVGIFLTIIGCRGRRTLGVPVTSYGSIRYLEGSGDHVVVDSTAAPLDTTRSGK